MTYLLVILIFLVLGLLFNKTYRKGVIETIGSFIVFTPVIIIGVLYNLFYPTIRAILDKDITLIPKLYWRLLQNTWAVLGIMLEDGFAIPYDILANVWGGEALEDLITYKESTTFGDLITISESIGDLEHRRVKIFYIGRKLSNTLNKIFQQTQHCLGTRLSTLEKRKIDKLNLTGKQ